MKVSELVQKYVELRDEKAQIQAEAAKKIQPIQAKMDMIEAALLGVFEKSGIDSTKTEFGTAYVSTRTSVSLADKESFREFCKQTGEWGLADIRASKVNVERYLEAHGQLPPGVNLSTERVVNIRRSA